MKRLIDSLTLVGVLTAVGAAHSQPASRVVNGDFTANAAAFTVSPGNINGGNPAGISSWQILGGGSSVGLNGARTSAGNTFGPTNPGGRTYAFIQSAQTLLGQYVTLAPNTQYKLDYDVAARVGNTSQYRVVVASSDSTGFNGLYYDSGVQSGNNAAFVHVTAYFTTPATPGASPNIQLWNVTGSGDNTIAYANVSLYLANPPYTFDDFNSGNDAGWTHYVPVPTSYIFFPMAWGSGAYQLWSPPGDSSSPGRIGSYRMDEPVRSKFHVEVDIMNWSTNKGQFMGVAARVQSVPTDGTFPAGYALVLRSSANGNQREDKLVIQRINSGTTLPTDLNAGGDVMGTAPIPDIAPCCRNYRLVFWSEGGFLYGQIIDKTTGIPEWLSNGVDWITQTIWAPEDGYYASGRSGLFSYVRIVGSTAQGVDPTFDNFYSGTDAPDTTPPSITCPANKTVNADSGQCSASGVALGTPTTSDNSGGSVTVWNNAPAQFNLGVTTVTWSAADPSGNTATGVQTATVNDTQPPTITCPADVTASANAGCTATGVALGSPVTGDNCSVASVTNNAPATYPLGTNLVTWTVRDGSGNTATGTQRVVVKDTTLPTITCPADVTVSANAVCTATGVALGIPVTGDSCSVASIGNNAPASYPLGTNLVIWTVRDGSGNRATCTQRVVVRDTTAPTITCPANVTVSANAGSTATNVALGSPVTGDNCSGVSAGNNALAAYPLGTTTVTWTATDGSGNTATCAQTVTVVSSPPGKPAISCHGGMVTITWSGGVLQQAGGARGVYTDVPGAASPYTTAVSGSQRFYRVRGAGL